MIRVSLPMHLRNLAKTGEEVEIDVEAPITQRSVLAALERSYPVLRGTIREHGTLVRRPFLRFFANGEDISLQSMDADLAPEIADGTEPFMVIGAIAGG